VNRVLITGAAGTIGRALRQGLQGRVGALRLLDLAPLGAPGPGEELVTADVRDLEAVTAAMEGVDAAVHLAAIPHEDSFDRIMENNVVGTYNVFEAARKQGCARVVFASSAHVTGFYDASERISPEMPVRPDSFYGVGKACGENLGRLYADKHGLQVACVRIGTLAERPTTPRHLSTWLSPRDAVELFWRCLVAPDIGFTVVYGTSATQRGWWDPGPAERLGYRPVDDAEAWAAEVNSTGGADPTESGEGPQGGSYAR
jgi:uronate dehydrogenase